MNILKSKKQTHPSKSIVIIAACTFLLAAAFGVRTIVNAQSGYSELLLSCARTVIHNREDQYIERNQVLFSELDALYKTRQAAFDTALLLQDSTGRSNQLRATSQAFAEGYKAAMQRYQSSKDSIQETYTEAINDCKQEAQRIVNCGNGTLDVYDDASFDEACDDNNTDADDGCSATCTIETGYSCTGEPSVCTNGGGSSSSSSSNSSSSAAGCNTAIEICPNSAIPFERGATLNWQGDVTQYGMYFVEEATDGTVTIVDLDGNRIQPLNFSYSVSMYNKKQFVNIDDKLITAGPNVWNPHLSTSSTRYELNGNQWIPVTKRYSAGTEIGPTHTWHQFHDGSYGAFKMQDEYLKLYNTNPANPGWMLGEYVGGGDSVSFAMYQGELKTFALESDGQSLFYGGSYYYDEYPVTGISGEVIATVVHNNKITAVVKNAGEYSTFTWGNVTRE